MTLPLEGKVFQWKGKSQRNRRAMGLSGESRGVAKRRQKRTKLKKRKVGKKTAQAGAPGRTKVPWMPDPCKTSALVGGRSFQSLAVKMIAPGVSRTKKRRPAPQDGGVGRKNRGQQTTAPQNKTLTIQSGEKMRGRM